jgi:hypothetical protein
MKHTRLFLLGTGAFMIAPWPHAAHASTAPAASGLEELSDAELGTMRGRYTIGDNQVAWFGVKMISTWQSTMGQTLQGTLAVSMDFTQGAPKVTFEPTVSITRADAPAPPLPPTAPSRSIDSRGLANVQGLVQSVQVAGDGNLASNTTHLSVTDGDSAPATASATTTPATTPATTAATAAATSAVTAAVQQQQSTSNPAVASAYGDGSSAVASFDGRHADVLLTIDGQGAVAQWIHDGSIGQTVQLTGDYQWASNRMEIALVRQSMAANTQLAQNVAQSLALARSVGLR